MHFRRKPHGISRSQAHEQKRAQQAPPLPPRSRRAALVRLAVRLFLYGGLLAAVTLLALIYSPLSSSWLDRMIQQRWLAATGLGLAVEGATLRIGAGTVELAHPRLLDPVGGRTLLEARRVLVEIPAAQFLFTRPPYAIRSVTVETSLTLPITIKDNRVSLGPDGDRIVALAAGRQRRARAARNARRTSPTLGLHDLTLNSVSIRLARERDGRFEPLLRLDDASLLAEFAGGPAPRRIGLTGRLNGKSAAPDLSLELRPDLARRVADLSLNLDRFDSPRDVPWPLPVAFSAARVELLARVGGADAAHWTLTGSSIFHGFNLAASGNPPDGDLGDARARFNLALDRNAVRLDVLSAALESKVCALRTSGTLALREPWLYALNVDPLQAQGRMFAVIAEALGRGRDVLRPGGAMLGLRAALRGDLRRPLPDEITGHLELAGLSLRSPELPPMDNMRLSAALTTQTLTIEDASAIVQGMPVAFTGVIRGQPLPRAVRSANVTWKANGDLVSVSSLIQGGTLPAGAPAALELSGQVAGAGRVFVSEPLAGSLASVIERTRVEGQIDLKGVTIRHPALLEPIRNLNGRVAFIENAARLTRGSAEWMGVNLVLNGQLKGRPLVWNQPRLTLAGTADFDIAKSRERLAEASPAMCQLLGSWPRVDGLADLDLALDAELARPAAADYTATLNLKDLATSFSTPYAGGPLRLDEVRLALKPRLFEVARAAGRWGELSLDLSGRITPTSATLRAAGGGSLEDLGRRIPVLARTFHLGGAADYDGIFTVLPREGFTPPATWRQWIDELRARPQPADWRPWAASRILLDGGGRLFARDAEWTFYAMPARLWAANGPLRFDLRRLWTPAPIPIRGGERSRECLGSIELVYPATLNDLLQGRPAGTTQFNYSVGGGHLAVEEWLRPWHFRHPRGAGAPANEPVIPYDPMAPVKFKMHGEFKTPTAAYRDLAITDFRTTLDLDVTPRQYSNLFAWRNVAGRLGQGDFLVQGQQTSTEVLTNVTINGIELEPLIKGLTGKEHVSGIFSGKLSGSLGLSQRGAPAGDGQLAGGGNLRIIESRFVSNQIFNSLGGLLRLPIFENISFSTIEGPFEFAGGRFTTQGITFENPTLAHINLVGAYGPAGALDMELQLQFLPKALGRIPLVGEALDMFNKLVGKVLRFKLRGTLEAPVISPL